MKTMKFPIDLSMLTEEEIDQFRQDPSTLFEGDTDVSLYLRFSSERQREQSIEGQLRDCRTFCKLNSYRITAIYVDRATTARKDVEKRVHFQEMIRDSEKKPWEYVVVWKLDRFARNRTDSALFKFRLRKNGVKVISATENISEKPEGIILEAVLEGMAEFYSADLSQKITRGMRESALKCHSIGGHVPLGYKIEDHKLVINPATAHIVREAFELYANGETVADICRMFNTKGYRTAKGVEFNRNSFKSMFRNKRYIGVYTYKDIEMEGGVPAIIDKELFETVSRRLSKNAEAPARGKAKVDYLLAGKLFCGHCGGSMNGESGTSRTGVVHNYYTCYTRKRKHACEKKPLKKEWIEYIVAQDAMELLTDDTIQELADMAISQTEKDLRENTRIPELTERMKETESGIANITNAIEKGIASDALMNRLVELEKEKKNLLRLLTEEEKYVCKIERSQIVYWLTEFKGGRIEDERYRRIIIDLMVNSVTVWDEPDGFRITTAYNLTSCKSKTFRIDPSSEKGFGFEGSKSTKKEPHLLVWLFYLSYSLRKSRDVTIVSTALSLLSSRFLRRDCHLKAVPGVFVRLHPVPGHTVPFTLIPGKIAEIELHLQMARKNVQDDLLDLGEFRRNTCRLRENHPQVSRIQFQRLGPDPAAADGTVDGGGCQAVPVDLQQGGNGSPALFRRYGSRPSGKELLPAVQAFILSCGRQGLPFFQLQCRADSIQPISQRPQLRSIDAVL